MMLSLGWEGSGDASKQAKYIACQSAVTAVGIQQAGGQKSAERIVLSYL